MLSSICSSRRFILAWVKFLSRLLTALILLPSIATLALVNNPIMRQSAMNREHTWPMARPLSLRKSVCLRLGCINRFSTCQFDRKRLYDLVDHHILQGEHLVHCAFI